MPDSEQHAFRAIPAVEALLRDPGVAFAAGSLPRAVVTGVVRDVLAEVRADVRASGRAPEIGRVTRRIQLALMLLRAGRPARIVNATGIVLHTNLGRAVLGERIAKRLYDVACGYSDVELDIATGERGRRESHVDLLLRVATGAEGALVVNNCAAAVLLLLDTFARGREVIVSRGELVEIGGSFRVPDVVARTGARLVEVGTTNKTRVADYRDAITDDTAALLKVHRSNFRMLGFVEEATTRELAELADERGLAFVRDLGSGEPGLEGRPRALAEEPTLSGEVAAGAHVVAASGDKLLGGPQAGLIVGRRAHVGKAARNPLYRALRPDKLTLAALSETLLAHLAGEADELPARRMLELPGDEIRRRADTLRDALARSCGDAAEVRVQPSTSEIGGGAAPALALETHVVVVTPSASPVHHVESRLRRGTPPVLVRVSEGGLHIDPRTLLDGEAEIVVRRIAEALGQEGATVDEPSGGSAS